MAPKRYSSYADIDRDLEILKLEKEIYYQKVVKTFGDTKENLNKDKLFSGIPGVAIDVISNFAGPLKGIAISYILKKFFKK